MNYMKNNRGKVSAWHLLYGYLIDHDIGHEFTKVNVMGININDDLDLHFDKTIYTYLQVLSNANVLEKINKHRFKIKRKLKKEITVSRLRRLMDNKQSLDDIYED